MKKKVDQSLYVRLANARPQNESYEHFILKQISKAWMFRKGARQIACEIEITGKDVSPNGLKIRADAVGVVSKNVYKKERLLLYREIRKKAFQIGRPLGLTMINRIDGSEDWIGLYKMSAEEVFKKRNAIRSCMEEACLELGVPRRMHENLTLMYKREYWSMVAETKVSRADFKSGYNVSGDYNYIFCPKGLLTKEDVPNYMGIVEVDLECFFETKSWEEATKVLKNAKRKVDSSFFKEEEGRVIFNEHEHFVRTQSLIQDIAQENTEETVFWNVFLKKTPDKPKSKKEMIEEIQTNLSVLLESGEEEQLLALHNAMTEILSPPKSKKRPTTNR